MATENPWQGVGSFHSDTYAINLRRAGNVLAMLADYLDDPAEETDQDVLLRAVRVVQGIDAANQVVELLPITSDYRRQVKLLIESAKLAERGFLHQVVELIQAEKDTEAVDLCKRRLLHIGEMLRPSIRTLAAECIYHAGILPEIAANQEDHEKQLAIEMVQAGYSWPITYAAIRGDGPETDSAIVEAFTKQVKRFAKATGQKLRKGTPGAPRKQGKK